MSKKQQQLNLRMDAEIYQTAKAKCQDQLGIGLATLVKVFLKAFTTQDGVGFFVGDVELRTVIRHWFNKKQMEIGRRGCAPLPGPLLKDLYDMKYY
ncbi:hypothetical protein ACFL10_00035 [Patescibacteria group bacterium]